MPPSPNSQNIESYANTLEVHLSNLHTRLVATLDALDEITRNHEMELIGLHDQTRQLRAKCQIFKARAKEAEAERDELKAAVNKLVEKVEIANDHRVLPHSRIHLPRPLDPIPPFPTIRLEEDVPVHAYIPAILKSLNAELMAEKYSFSELQRVSEARIATLEAQVARREAELYACKPCSCRSGPTSEPSASGAHKAKLQPGGITLSKAQYTLIEEETAMRQRTLEVEIDGLRQKLQSARSETFRPKLPPLAPQGLRDTSAKFRDSPSSHSTIRHVQPEPTNPVLSDIDQQLARINKEMDNLQAERNNIKTAVNTGREDDGSCPGDLSNQDFKGVLLIEEECIRLRESERLLRQEMLLATAAASATEQSLKSLVTRLQEQIHMLRNPGTSGGSIHGETGPDPEEESSNDVTSEHSIFSHGRPFSALPLRSSTPPAQSTRTALLSGIKIDGPTHERPSSDRPPSAPPLFPSHNPVARLARIESELNQARNDVEDKDKLISTLQAQLVALQNAAQAGTFREMGGAKDDKKG